jgi:hypothetical protein
MATKKPDKTAKADVTAASEKPVTPTAATAAHKDSPAEAVADAVEHDAKIVAKGGIGWLSVLVAGFFGLLYAYFVWTGVDTMLKFPDYYSSQFKDPANIPWWVLWIALAVPVVVYAFAFVATIRRDVFVKAIIYVTGLGVTAGLTFGLDALQQLIMRDVPLLLQLQ